MSKRQNAAQRAVNAKSFQDAISVAQLLRELATFDVPFSLPVVQPEVGAAYFVAKCPACSSDMAVISDPTDGIRANPIAGSARITIAHSGCKEIVEIRPTDLFQLTWK